MFESLSYLVLQQYWWCIMSLLGAILVFLMFVQGGQTLIFSLGKNDIEQKMIINALGRKWEFTFTTLVTFGGAFFASFPLFYATSFGGAYWVWVAILFAFVIQAVSYEYRSKPGNVYGRRFFEILLFINGILGTILIGTAVATFFTGSPFMLDLITNQVEWVGPAYGLSAIWNSPLNLCLGIAIFFLARTLALLYFISNIDSKDIFARSKKKIWVESILFLAFFLTFLIGIMLIDGAQYDPNTKFVSMVPNKYFHNILEMPINTIILLIGIVLVLFGLGLTLFKKRYKKGIWPTGFGVILVVFSLFILAGFNNTSFYPAFNPHLQNSLTIENASSSRNTLVWMSYISLIVPFVLAYIRWAWRVINKDKITEDEMINDSHAY